MKAAESAAGTSHGQNEPKVAQSFSATVSKMLACSFSMFAL